MFQKNTLTEFFKISEGLTLLYGPSASGKSTLAMQSSLKFAREGKVLFFDTEKSFSVDRIKVMDKEYKKLLDNIFVVRIKDFNDQHDKLKKVEMLVKKGKFNYVVIDSFGVFYRHALHNHNYAEVNEAAVSMLRNLKHVVRLGIPVLVTNQVYSGDEGEIKTLGGNMIKNFSDYIFELVLEPRTIKMYKPKEKKIRFVINDSGLVGV
jgi:RecA/RadA recombinase